MNKIIALVFTVTLLAICGGSYVSNYNYGNRAEKTIVAEYENLQNVLSQYSLIIKEAAQIPNMQTDDLAELFTGSIEARYGKGGSDASFQWLKEQNPNLDQATYLKIQNLIEAGRNKFENHQTKFIDTKRTYETNLGYFWKGTWLRIAGYPTINLDEYKIIKSQHAIQTFETGVDNGLQLR